MFTGLIQNIGTITRVDRRDGTMRLEVNAPLNDLESGESIAVNGVCLTALPEAFPHLAFDVSSETLALTTLGGLEVGSKVNIERAMTLKDRLGGHIVSGHVDCFAQVLSFEDHQDHRKLHITGFSKEDMGYLVKKGSIAIDGVSLTINAIDNNTISLMLVPHTLAHTTLCDLKQNQKVNIEFDSFTRIVAHQLKLFGLIPQEVLS